MLAMGCDRLTACRFLRHQPAQLAQAIEGDPELAARLYQAEATAEFKHMKTLHEAAKDPTNWRVCVWWLEVHAPERFVSRSPHSLTAKQLLQAIEDLAGIIADAVEKPDDQQRVLERLADCAAELREEFDLATW